MIFIALLFLAQLFSVYEIKATTKEHPQMINRYLHDKLVRDKTPERLVKKGALLHYVILDDASFVQELFKKLHEESTELQQCKTNEERSSELADALEVIHGFCSAFKIDFEEVKKIREEKFIARGGFEKRIFATVCDAQENGEADQYFVKNSDQYKKIS
jgi:predicted house-cleaning noncanonical NTP pyrophosphatase (MazG superfamily)